MTSVPKPLKFLRPHLQTLKDTYAKLKPGESNEDIGTWGHEVSACLLLSAQI